MTGVSPPLSRRRLDCPKWLRGRPLVLKRMLKMASRTLASQSERPQVNSSNDFLLLNSRHLFLPSAYVPSRISFAVASCVCSDTSSSVYPSAFYSSCPKLDVHGCAGRDGKTFKSQWQRTRALMALGGSMCNLVFKIYVYILLIKIPFQFAYSRLKHISSQCTMLEIFSSTSTAPDSITQSSVDEAPYCDHARLFDQLFHFGISSSKSFRASTDVRIGLTPKGTKPSLFA